MIYATPALYRSGAVFMMSNTTAQYLRKLKTGVSGDKRALWGFWQEGNAVEGVPPSLHGYPVVFNDDLPSVISAGTWATTDSPVIFGNFQKFLIRRAGPTRILRFPVPAKDASAAIVFDRSDSKLLIPTAITKLTCHS
jgi:HK97 family phage major capsid protein